MLLLDYALGCRLVGLRCGLRAVREGEYTEFTSKVGVAMQLISDQEANAQHQSEIFRVRRGTLCSIVHLSVVAALLSKLT